MVAAKSNARSTPIGDGEERSQREGSDQRLRGAMAGRGKRWRVEASDGGWRRNIAGGGERSPAEGSRQSVAVSDSRFSRVLVKDRLSLPAAPGLCSSRLSRRRPCLGSTESAVLVRLTPEMMIASGRCQASLGLETDSSRPRGPCLDRLLVSVGQPASCLGQQQAAF